MKKLVLILIAVTYFGYLSTNAQCVFYIGSGSFKLPDGATVKGYSGRNIGDGYDYRNRPEQTQAKSMGAIPTGTYYITGVNSNIGSNTIVLTNDIANDMYGRDNFRIHGDNSNNNASQGCIILNASARAQIVSAYNDLKRKREYLTLYVYE